MSGSDGATRIAPSASINIALNIEFCDELLVRLTLLLWPLHIFLNEGREKEKPYLPVGGLWRRLA
jgi:hypothetical protein